MKQSAMHKLVAAEQAVNGLLNLIGQSIYDPLDHDNYVVEEARMASVRAARTALHAVRTAIATVRLVDDDVVADASYVDDLEAALSDIRSSGEQWWTEEATA